MAVDESEGPHQNEEKNVLLPDQDVISINQEHESSDRTQDSSDSSSIFSSEASLEAPIQPEAQSGKFTSLSEEEQKGSANDPTTELGDSSDNSSLFSNEPKALSFGEDRGLLSSQETCTSEEPTNPNIAASNPPSSSVKPTVKNVGQEKILETKEAPQDKTKQFVGNPKSPKPTLNRINSAASESSSYSFAFPILVPGLPQRASRKKDAINPQGRVSLSLDDPDLEGENSISRPSQQKI
ncbi:hypothetical protein V2J09_012950 [Rumex salicifolius]